MRLKDKVSKVPGPQFMDISVHFVAYFLPTGMGFSPFSLYFTLRALFIYLKEKDIQSK